MADNWYVLNERPKGGFFAGIFIDPSDNTAWVSTQTGYLATPEEIRVIFKKLLETAEEHAEEIDEKNRSNTPDEWPSDYKEDSAKADITPRHVYLFRCGDRYKIGVSSNVKRRLKQLDNRPYPVELVVCSDVMKHALDAEKSLHEMYGDMRLSGEWFDFDDETAEEAERIIKSLNDEDFVSEEETFWQ